MDLPEAPQDGLPTRPAHRWTKDKLGIIACYTHGFGVACKRWRTWFYVDGFSGPGVNVVDGTERVPGSPLIALQTDPAFARCLLLDRRRGNVQALAVRTHPFGKRAVVERGDCNTDLMPLMHQHIDPGRPGLCLLDPEGLEVAWTSVEAIANFSTRKMKMEQLILFDIDGIERVMPVFATDASLAPALARFWGPLDWRSIYDRRIKNELTLNEARTDYLGLYVDGLKNRLGYKWVLNREIRARGRYGAIQYFLIFATDNATGERIMDHCFNTVVIEEGDPTLPGFEPPIRRDV